MLQWDGCLTLTHLAWPWHGLSQSRTHTHTFLACTLHTCIQRKPCWCATSLHWCCHSCGSWVATSCAALCFTLYSYKDSKRVSWLTLQQWHREWHWICAVGSSVAAVLRHLWVKFQGCQLLRFAGLTVLFPGGYYLLSLKLWPSWLQTKAWKHGILRYFEVWLMTFYHEGHILLPPFNFPLSLCMQPHLQMFREECLHSCTLKAASVYAKVSSRVHRCHYSQRAGAGVLLDGAACV